MRNSRWAVYAKKADFKKIAQTFGIDQVTARIIRNRDVVGEEAIRAYLQGTLEDLHDPAELTDARKAADILRQKIAEGRKIRIIGDYDIDGVCATAILYEVLTRLGADVDYEIPDRILDGYGLNQKLVEYALAEGVDTILTCDNGISAVEQTDFALGNGMTVVITDHHQPGEVLPRAQAVVDPCRKDDPYPFNGICGAVVAWKLMQLLTGKTLEEYLDLAAFATVGDVMDLRDENRVIVKLGLERLARTERIGMQALIRENGLEGKTLGSYHIGFVLGPCINAGGRLDTAKDSLALLLADERIQAERLAKELVALNLKRRELTEDGLARAISLLESETEDMPSKSSTDRENNGNPEGLSNHKDDKVLIVYLPDCHESVAGIIAGKIRERYYRPSIVLTDSGKEGILKGSARSIESYHIYQGLCGCADLLQSFGGHPMAAGLSLKREDLPAFIRRINDQADLTEADLTEKRMIDVPVPMYYLNEALINEFSLLEPFGKGNERPLFALQGVRLSGGRIIGQSQNVFKCMITDASGKSLEGIWFGDTRDLLLQFWEMWGREETGRLMRGQENDILANVLYYPQINEYRGWKSVQIRIVEIRKARENAG